MEKVKPLPAAVLKELELQNKARVHAGLKPIQVIVRQCNQCQKPFQSKGNRNCGCNSIHTASLAGMEIV